MKLLKNKIIKDTSWIIISQVIGILATMALSSILTYSLTVNDYGSYQLMLSYVSIGSIISLTGFNQSITKSATKDYDNLLPRIFKISIKGSLTTQIVFLLIGIYLVFFENKIESGFLYIISSFYFITYSFNFFDSFLVGKKEFKLSRRLYVQNQILRLIAIGSVGFLFKNIVYVLLTDVIIQLIYTINGYIIAKKKINSEIINIEFENELLKLGWRMTALSVLNFLSTKVEKLILGFLDPKYLAIYTIGEIIPRRIRDNSKQFLIVPVTHWASLSKDENISKLFKYWWLFILIGIFLFLFIYLSSFFLIPLLFSQKYVESIYITQLLAIPLIFIFLQTMILNMAIFQGSEKIYQNLQIFSTLIKLLLLYIFIPKFDIVGVAYSTIITETISFIIILAWFLKTKNKLSI